MRKTALIATLLALPIACSPPATEELEPSPEIEAIAEESHVSEAEHALHWDYGEEVGPAQWGGLSPDFAMCDEGMMQSPIDIAGPFADVEEMDLRRDFKPVEMLVSNQPSSVDLLDNGHTIQVSSDEGNAIQVGETSFELAQYHFHAPSEHTLEGRHFPMEVHFVHVSEDGILAVAGAFIDEGAHNAAFDPIWNSFPVEVGESRYLEGHDVDLDSLVPAGSDYYRYIGSLTTPPCSEGVNWIVRTEPLTLSAEQIAAFTAIINNNNRPTQPLNGRVITTGSPSYVE